MDLTGRTGQPHGFSLLEMIVVVAILGLLVAIVAPVTTQSMQASRLNTSAANLANQLNSARMLAIRLNQPVDVRFLRYSDRETPGGSPTYAAYQVWVNGSPHQSIVRLEPGVVLATSKSAGGNAWSSILDPQANAWGADQPLPKGYEIPRATNSASARNSYFQFRPDGSTNLPGNQQWTLTLVHEKDAVHAELPPNFVAIILDSLNGRVRTLSP